MKHLVPLIDLFVDSIKLFASIKEIVSLDHKLVSCINNFWIKVSRLSFPINLKKILGKCSKKYCTLLKDFALLAKLSSIMAFKKKLFNIFQRIVKKKKMNNFLRVINYQENK